MTSPPPVLVRPPPAADVLIALAMVSVPPAVAFSLVMIASFAPVVPKTIDEAGDGLLPARSCRRSPARRWSGSACHRLRHARHRCHGGSRSAAVAPAPMRRELNTLAVAETLFAPACVFTLSPLAPAVMRVCSAVASGRKPFVASEVKIPANTGGTGVARQVRSNLQVSRASGIADQVEPSLAG